MNKKLLSLYSLKFNPFSSEVPTSALWSTPSIQSFCWRIEQQIGEGGFALAIGDPGTGKSAALRILVERLGNLADVMVGVLTRPQAAIADLYRELGHLFSVPLAPHNRWASAKVLREKWLHHIDNSLYRPVLLIDEAQEMSSSALSELRLLSSVELDLQFGHFQRFITARIVDILGRSGLNHGGVANDVRRGALAEGLGLNLFAQECYQVLAGGTPSGTAPLG